MKILALDTSATSASCAVVEDGKVVASAYIHTALKHSETLMPMVENMLSSATQRLSDMDYMTVCAGPGSFTGVRIGVSALKGMAFLHQTPCVAVSTLAAIAQNAAGIFEGTVCAVMDARCNQVYTALFSAENGYVRRISEDAAISADDLKSQLSAIGGAILLVGDGAQMYYDKFRDATPSLILAPAHLRFQNAVGAAFQAAVQISAGETVSPDALQPAYLRLPQAERELRARQAQEVNT